MKPVERQLKIIDLIHQQGKVSVAELVVLFGTSAETIRRDLAALAARGKLQKTHGGARAPGIVGEGSFQQRLRKNVGEKRQLAKSATALIHPGDTLFIDTGSTTLTFAEEVCHIDNLTVTTNSTDVAKVIAMNETAQVYLLGGRYNADNHQSVGSLVITQLKNFSANKAILTIGGIHQQAGLTDYNIEEALVAQAMITQAEKIIVLADSSKLNKVAPFVVCELAKVDHFISYHPPDSVLQHALNQHSVNTVIAHRIADRG